MNEVRKMHGWKTVGTKSIPGWSDPVVLRVRASGAGSMEDFPKWASAFVDGFQGELDKIADEIENLARLLKTDDPDVVTRHIEESESLGVHPMNLAMRKMAKDMPSFTKQKRDPKAISIYKKLKEEHPTWPAGKKARIAHAAANESHMGAGDQPGGVIYPRKK